MPGDEHDLFWLTVYDPYGRGRYEGIYGTSEDEQKLLRERLFMLYKYRLPQFDRIKAEEAEIEEAEANQADTNQEETEVVEVDQAEDDEEEIYEAMVDKHLARRESDPNYHFKVEYELGRPFWEITVEVEPNEPIASVLRSADPVFLYTCKTLRVPKEILEQAAEGTDPEGSLWSLSSDKSKWPSRLLPLFRPGSKRLMVGMNDRSFLSGHEALTHSKESADEWSSEDTRCITEDLGLIEGRHVRVVCFEVPDKRKGSRKETRRVVALLNVISKWGVTSKTKFPVDMKEGDDSFDPTPS